MRGFAARAHRNDDYESAQLRDLNGGVKVLRAALRRREAAIVGTLVRAQPCPLLRAKSVEVGLLHLLEQESDRILQEGEAGFVSSHPPAIHSH